MPWHDTGRRAVPDRRGPPAPPRWRRSSRPATAAAPPPARSWRAPAPRYAIRPPAGGGILQKSPSSDIEAARKRLAEERAGLAAPPADPRTPSVNQSVIERLFRLESAAGATLERRLAAELGPDKAHQIRAAGWVGGDDSILYGCPD
jgi:hypothetical protein